jgi:hypothetical protein
MSEASEKQTAILLKNGFKQEDIDKMNKKAISDEIGKIFGKPKEEKTQQGASNAVLGATGGISEVHHIFQNEHEFGPAGNRWKLRFFTLEEYKQKREELENSGFLDPSLSN